MCASCVDVRLKLAEERFLLYIFQLTNIYPKSAEAQARNVVESQITFLNHVDDGVGPRKPFRNWLNCEDEDCAKN